MEATPKELDHCLTGLQPQTRLQLTDKDKVYPDAEVIEMLQHRAHVVGVRKPGAAVRKE